MTDMDEYLIVENSICREMTMANHRYTKANNLKCSDYDSSKLTTWILYKDINALYSSAITQYMLTEILEKRMFHALFDLVSQLTESSPQFKHIHGTGWSCIIDDLNYAQAKAFGLVLNEIDATKNWKNHLINVFKSCYVHFKR
ncbi:unnamed protein product [Rhizophagus irregularis]|nr:unnamed protein product [Rhizophagus irregularis]CAB5394081.1 unnamed protein product [Rhizophagus irregularis]CAB5395531.1 unnamed protein product [Rhizophagus irregularis]